MHCWIIRVWYLSDYCIQYSKNAEYINLLIFRWPGWWRCRWDWWRDPQTQQLMVWLRGSETPAGRLWERCSPTHPPMQAGEWKPWTDHRSVIKPVIATSSCKMTQWGHLSDCKSVSIVFTCGCTVRAVHASWFEFYSCGDGCTGSSCSSHWE